MIDAKEILNTIPHRYPILLIDGVESLKPMVSIHAWKNISASEQILQGHFPDNPVFPGVFAVEALSQAAALLGLKSVEMPPKNLLYMLAGLDNVRFKRKMMIGDRLDLHVDYVGNKRSFWKFSCKAKVKGEIACTADILCAVVNSDS